MKLGSSKANTPLAEAGPTSASAINICKKGKLLGKFICFESSFCFGEEWDGRKTTMWTPRLVKKQVGRHMGQPLQPMVQP